MKLLVDFVIYFIALIQLTDSLDKEKVHHGKWLNLRSADNEAGFYMFDWLVQVNIKQCVEACKSTRACEYMNYEVRTHKCVLIRRDDDKQANNNPIVETKPGHVFGNNSEWADNTFSICVDCDNYGKCHINGSSESEYSMCRNSGCRKPSVDFHGNSFAVGGSIRPKYNGGQVFLSNSMICSENGTWDVDQSVCMINGRSTCFNGSYYYIETNSMTWLEAKMHCESLSGHLVDVNTEEEQTYLDEILTKFFGQTNVAGSLDWIWTGGNDLEANGDFVWSDGSTFSSYTNWIMHNPDNAGGAEHCVHLWKRGSIFEWNDMVCNTPMRSVCEFP